MEQARFNMVEQQIRPWDVLDVEVLDFIEIRLSANNVVPADQRALAFMDLDIPLGFGAKMWQPKMEARALQALALKHGDHALEVGTGSGYLTALMACLATQVTSVEIVPELSAQLNAIWRHTTSTMLRWLLAMPQMVGAQRYMMR